MVVSKKQKKVQLRKRIENDKFDVSRAATGSFREKIRTYGLDEDGKY